LYKKLQSIGVAGALDPPAVVVAATFMAFAKFIPFENSRFPAPEAGIPKDRTGVVVPSVTVPDVSNIWM
jgi:hypothetical protein